MLDSSLNKVLLVESYNNKKWSFPKGKKKKNEEDIKCAVREVDEECSINIVPYLDPDKVYVKNHERFHPTTLFFALNVPDDREFYPKFEMEVSDYKWWSIEELFKECKGGSNQKLSIIYPFLDDIKKYCDDKKKVHEEKFTEKILALLDKSITKEAKHDNENISRAKTTNPNDSRPLSLKEDVCADRALSITDSSEMENEGKQTNELKNQIDVEYSSFAPMKFSLSASLNLKKFIPKSLNLVTDHGNVVVELNEE